jgi:hypothetical protein
MIDNLLKSAVFAAALMAAVPADAGLSAGFAGLRSMTVAGGSLAGPAAAFCIADRSAPTSESLALLLADRELYDI